MWENNLKIAWEGYVEELLGWEAFHKCFANRYQLNGVVLLKIVWLAATAADAAGAALQ